MLPAFKITPQLYQHHMRPAPAQRLRLIERFHERKMASDPRSLEHQLCACVVLALLYGGSTRTINGVAKRTRASWRCPGGLHCDMNQGCAYNPPCPYSRITHAS